MTDTLTLWESSIESTYVETGVSQSQCVCSAQTLKAFTSVAKLSLYVNSSSPVLSFYSRPEFNKIIVCPNSTFFCCNTIEITRHPGDMGFAYL